MNSYNIRIHDFLITIVLRKSINMSIEVNLRDILFKFHAIIAIIGTILN